MPEVEPIYLILLVLAGVCAGFINVLAGGGSLITMPVMLFMGISGPLVNGTNRIAITIQNLSAIAGFKKKGFSDFKLSISLAACAMPGAAAGALIGTQLEGVWFNRMLAGIMVAVIILTATQGKKANPVPEMRAQNLVWGHCLMVLAGAYVGFIQAGAGFIVMPILHRIMGLNLVRTNMHKVFIIGMCSIIALIVFATKGHVYWWLGLILATGNATGGWIASHVAVDKGDGFIKIVLNIALIGMAVKLLFFS